MILLIGKACEPERRSIHLDVCDGEESMQRVEVLDERLNTVSKGHQHLIVAGLQTIREEIIAENLQHRRQRNAYEHT